MSDVYIEAVVQLRELKLAKKEIEDSEKELTKTIVAGRDLGEIDDDTITMLGLEPRKRSGSYDDAMVALCKQKGLVDCYAVKEVLVQDEVKEAVASGQITEEEAQQYKKPDTVYFQLPRSKS